MDINMPRDAETGKPKGFCFLMYEDQRSTVLAVDNMTGAQVLGRTIRVSHVHACYSGYRRAECDRS
jgi:RNA-binding motif X-linked protein 2